MGGHSGIKAGSDYEERIQSQCYVWFHNSFPELRGLLNYNLNNSKNRIDGARNKALGLQAGRSDMVLYFDCRAYMVEFKTPKGRQSEKQKEWQGVVESQGFEYLIVRSVEEFQRFVAKVVKDE